MPLRFSLFVPAMPVLVAIGYRATFRLIAVVDLPATSPASQDPAGLLEGSGKVHRHLKIRQPADLDRPDLRDLMTAALNQAS